MWLIDWLEAISVVWSQWWADAVTPPPEWSAAGAGYIATIMGTAGSLCTYVPLEMFGPAVAFVFGFWALGFGLRVWLMAAGAATPGGLV